MSSPLGGAQHGTNPGQWTDLEIQADACSLTDIKFTSSDCLILKHTFEIQITPAKTKQKDCICTPSSKCGAEGPDELLLDLHNKLKMILRLQVVLQPRLSWLDSSY